MEARDKGTPPSRLRDLSVDEDVAVRIAVARNKSTDPDTRMGMFLDHNVNVKAAVVSMPDIDEDVANAWLGAQLNMGESPMFAVLVSLVRNREVSLDLVEAVIRKACGYFEKMQKEQERKRTTAAFRDEVVKVLRCRSRSTDPIEARHASDLLATLPC